LGPAVLDVPFGTHLSNPLGTKFPNPTVSNRVAFSHTVEEGNRLSRL